MKIVRQNTPPSMSVIVDTIVSGDVVLLVEHSHPVLERIDYVYVKQGMIGIVKGLTYEPLYQPHNILPILPRNVRTLAKIIVHASTSAIYDTNIVEFVSWTKNG